MALITNEIPTGTINGINTVFILSNNISQIDEVWVDGAAYFGTVTVLNAEITLGDAPTATIRVDYFTAPPTSPSSAITVADARTILLSLKKDLSDVSTQVFLSWCNFSNREAYRAIISAAPRRLLRNTNYTVTSASQSYTLPVDFLNMQPLGTGIFLVDANGNDTDTMWPLQFRGSGEQGYFIEANKLWITPVPTKPITLRMSYIPILNDLTGDTSAFCFPDGGEYQNYLQKALDALYAQWDEDPNAELMSNGRFNTLLDYFIDTVRQQPQTESLPDFSVTF